MSNWYSIEEMINMINNHRGLLQNSHGLGEHIWPSVLHHTSWMDVNDYYSSQEIKYNRKIHKGPTSQQRWSCIKHNISSEEDQPVCKFCKKVILRINSDGRIPKTCSSRCSNQMRARGRMGDRFYDLYCPFRLKMLYEKNGCNGKELSKILKVGFAAVYDRMGAYSIKAKYGRKPSLEEPIKLVKRHPNKKISEEAKNALRSREKLEQLIVDNSFSYKNVSRLLGVSDKLIRKKALDLGCSLEQIKKDREPFKTLMVKQNLEDLYKSCGNSSNVAANKLNVSSGTILYWMKRHDIKTIGVGGGDVMSKTRIKNNDTCQIYLAEVVKKGFKAIKIGISRTPKKRLEDIKREGCFSEVNVKFVSQPLPYWKCGVVEHILQKQIGCVRISDNDKWAGHTECFHPCFATRCLKVLDALQVSDLEYHHNQIFGG